jgi:hypothetical protein
MTTNIPKHWPAELKREFRTPIDLPYVVDGNLTPGTIRLASESLRKLVLLREHYGCHGEEWIFQLLLHLCTDIFPGFREAKKKGRKGATRRTELNDAVLVTRINDIKMRDGVGVTKAAKALARERPEYSNDRPETLKTRYQEALRRPDVQEVVTWLTASTSQHDLFRAVVVELSNRGVIS